jgi:hypothetical protein
MKAPCGAEACGAGAENDDALSGHGE